MMTLATRCLLVVSLLACTAAAAMPVSRFVSVIFAPCTMPPLASRTVPRTLPASNWLNAGATNRSAKKNRCIKTNLL